MRKQLFVIFATATLLLCAFGASAQVVLYPEVQVTAAQKIKGVWARVLYSYYHNGDLSAEVSAGVTLREWLEVPANRQGLSYTSTAAWPNVSVMQSHLYQNPEHPNTLKLMFFEMRQWMEQEIARAAVTEAVTNAEWEGS